MKSTLALFLVAILVPGCVAQEPAVAAKPFAVEAGETKLTEFIDRCAAYLQWNVLTADQEMAGAPAAPIRLQQRIEVDRAGCEDLLTSMLVRSGFVLTVVDERKHLYEVLNLSGPRGREIIPRAVRRTPEEVLARPALRFPVTTVVELQHINAPIATNALRPFFASAGGGMSSLTIGNAGNNTTILLSGLQDQVATAIGLLRTADVPERPELDMNRGGEQLWKRLDAIERRLAELEQRLPPKGR